MISIQRHERGFTLIELLLGLVLGILVTGGLFSVYVNAKKSFRQDEAVSRMQDEARFALRELTRDIAMTKFYAESILPESVDTDASAAGAPTCDVTGGVNWVTQLNANIVDANLLTFDNVAAGTVSGVLDCFANGEVAANTDVIGVKHYSSRPVPATTAGELYARTNGTVTSLYVAPFAGALTGPVNDYAIRTQIYFISPDVDPDADIDTPGLCRKTLQDAGGGNALATECIAQGIEDIQIMYGVDTNRDGNVNAYVDQPTLAQMPFVISARISLLARTVTEDIKYTDPNTYSVGNAPDRTPADNFYRRVYTAQVRMPNQRNLALFVPDPYNP